MQVSDGDGDGQGGQGEGEAVGAKLQREKRVGIFFWVEENGLGSRIDQDEPRARARLSAQASRRDVLSEVTLALLLSRLSPSSYCRPFSFALCAKCVWKKRVPSGLNFDHHLRENRS